VAELVHIDDRLELAYLRPGLVTYPPGATFGPRCIQDYELVWILRGQVVYHADGQDYPAPDGTVVLCRPGTQDGFTWDPERPTRHGFVHFAFTARPEHWPKPERWPLRWWLPEHDVVRPLLRYVLGAGRREGEVEPTLRSAFETLLGALLVGPVSTAGAGMQDYPEPVARALWFARRQLDADPAASIDLEDLAEAASVSREHLCRLFKTTLDTGPVQAVRLMRFDEAVGLLARSNLSVQQIAHRCGFASPHHFSRRFREIYHQTPTEVRQRVLRGYAPPVTPLSRLIREI